ncbi:hypothetical protein [Lacimicrobium alkaliphilum]|nr:hypothetical protein [Lacimicrobium alkaliphilum]
MNSQSKLKQQDSSGKAKNARVQESRIELWLRRIGKALKTEQMVKYK